MKIAMNRCISSQLQLRESTVLVQFVIQCEMKLKKTMDNYYGIM